MNTIYTIIDVETTGNGIYGNKITEIAIYKIQGDQVIDAFESLVNPQCPIPNFITGLTGIDDNMVHGAPTFAEIATSILEITKDAIFVAHSVNFDYHVIKNEFRLLGMDYVRKKLCTLRLSRKLFPGLVSYSLGKLCTALKIPLTNRHRAGGDAKATVLLFQKILDAKGSEQLLKQFLNARSQEAILPPGLSKKVLDALPAVPGIYFFLDTNGKIIYIGKAINIKKRVLGHFYNKSNNEVALCTETKDIDYKRSGSELVALLMESAAIKKHYPKYNSAQKISRKAYGVLTFEDRSGIKHLAVNQLRSVSNPIATFYSKTEARAYLEQLCAQFELCPKYCHLQEQVTQCNHFKLNCLGVCRGEETKNSYNARVDKALERIKKAQKNFLIKEKGRDPKEDAFILVQEDCYRGYGFLSKEMEINNLIDLESQITLQKNTKEAQGILKAYLSKNPFKARALSEIF